MTRPTIIGELLQQQESPFFPRKFLVLPPFFWFGLVFSFCGGGAAWAFTS